MIVCFGEILLRLSAEPPKLLMQDGRLDATICGAEANVAVGLSGFGDATRMVSVVPNNRLGAAARAELGKYGVDTSSIRSASGRMGLFFLTPGAMARPAEIIYDRAGSAFAQMGHDDIDWASELAGADWLFISGITAALGNGPLASLRGAVAAARQKNVRIAFDCNYRPSLWEGRDTEAWDILRELSFQADLLFAGRRAIGRMLEKKFDDTDGDAGFRTATGAMFASAPGVSHIAATRREIWTANSQSLTGLIASRTHLAISPIIALDDIVDRVGTGDAFAAGVVHGLVNGLALEETVRFATASAQWAHGVSGDFLRASVEDIEAIQHSVGDIRR